MVSLSTEAQAPAELVERQSTSPRRLLRRLMQYRAGLVGALLLLVVAVIAVAGHWIAPYDPAHPFLGRSFDSATPEFVLGNDELGRDVFSRLLVGTRATVSVGVIAIAVAALIGVPLGLIAGYLLGPADVIISFVVDCVLAFPGLLLAMTLVGVLGPGTRNIAIAIGISSFPAFARLARGSALALRNTAFVEAARALGATRPRIILTHIWPNSIAPLIVEAALAFGFAVAAEAALSFLGIGLKPPAPTWGGMVRDGLKDLRTAPHLVFWPSAAIFVTILGSNLLGDGIRDALDPRLRRR